MERTGHVRDFFQTSLYYLRIADQILHDIKIFSQPLLNHADDINRLGAIGMVAQELGKFAWFRLVKYVSLPLSH